MCAVPATTSWGKAAPWVLKFRSELAVGVLGCQRRHLLSFDEDFCLKQGGKARIPMLPGSLTPRLPKAGFPATPENISPIFISISMGGLEWTAFRKISSCFKICHITSIIMFFI